MFEIYSISVLAFTWNLISIPQRIVKDLMEGKVTNQLSDSTPKDGLFQMGSENSWTNVPGQAGGQKWVQ
jgi:hypothetical protein